MHAHPPNPDLNLNSPVAGTPQPSYSWFTHEVHLHNALLGAAGQQVAVQARGSCRRQLAARMHLPQQPVGRRGRRAMRCEQLRCLQWVLFATLEFMTAAL